MHTKLKVFLYDVVLALFHIVVDVYLIWSYFDLGDKWWAGATITAVLLPGALEFLTYTYSFLHGDLEGTKSQQLGEYVTWTFFSLFYPVSLIIYHIYHAFYKQDFARYEVMARSKVLTSLNGLTKSALQLVLQTTILMITWGQYEDWHHGYQITSAMVSAIMIAKSSTDHFYFESSGKDVKVHVPNSRMIKRLLFNLSHVLLRGFLLSLLASYLQSLTAVLVGLLILSNFVSANLLIQTDRSKHIWTACAAVLLPTCYVSRDTIIATQDKGFGQRIFARFNWYNTVLFFFLVGCVGLVGTNVLVRFTDVNKFDCDNIPFLSFDPDKLCPAHSPFQDNPSIFGLPPPHSWFHFLGSLFVLLFSILHVITVSLEEKIIGDLEIQNTKNVKPV